MCSRIPALTLPVDSEPQALPRAGTGAIRAREEEAMGATLGTQLLTWLRGALVGTDAYGNRYYRLRGDKPARHGGGRFGRDRRWVIYNGEPEGSKGPPE